MLAGKPKQKHNLLVGGGGNYALHRMAATNGNYECELVQAKRCLKTVSLNEFNQLPELQAQFYYRYIRLKEMTENTGLLGRPFLYCGQYAVLASLVRNT